MNTDEPTRKNTLESRAAGAAKMEPKTCREMDERHQTVRREDKLNCKDTRGPRTQRNEAERVFDRRFQRTSLPRPSGRSDRLTAVCMQMSAWRFTYKSRKRTVRSALSCFTARRHVNVPVEDLVGFHSPLTDKSGRSTLKFESRTSCCSTSRLGCRCSD